MPPVCRVLHRLPEGELIMIKYKLECFIADAIVWVAVICAASGAGLLLSAITDH